MTILCCVLAGGLTLAWMLVPLPEVSVRAQPDASSTRCDAVLTAEEAVAIVGDGYQGPAVEEPRPGFTSCDWQGSDSNFGFTFASLTTLRADQTTPEDQFDMDLRAVENATRKRQLLPGIGVSAATVDLGDGAALVEVQRADGLARMIVYKVDRDKMLALAKAIAAP